MTPAELADAVRQAVAAAVDAGELAVPVPERVTIERPRQREHGDYATNAALQLAKPAGRPPRAVAETLATRLRDAPGIDAVEIAGPGFLNFRLAQGAAGELARLIVRQKHEYGRSDANAGESVNLEFVSANPTGPIHIGAVRWAAVGDALARLLEATGARVGREYYFNDAGSQIDRYSASLLAAAKGEPTPEDGYAGAYIDDIAKAVVQRHPHVLSLPDDEAREVFRAEGIELMFGEIKRALAEFGVHFDVYFNEKTLHETGRIEAALQRLREQGRVFQAEDATWIRTTDFGDDRDRVFIRRNGSYTYYAADCAYYLDKRSRGFDRVVIMLGADHHGYVGRLRAMCAAFGDDPDRNIEILIGQMVNLVKDGQPVKMSKRAGTVVSLEDLVDAVGKDAARYALARASVDSPIDLDLDLLARQSNDNPVYYVQYAHARLASLVRHAVELGVTASWLHEGVDSVDVALLGHERENDLLGALGEYPRVVASAAELRAPHRVARYLEELAGTFHRFYDACRILPRGDEEPSPVMDARLLLCEATRVVLRNGLDLLGVSAPDHM